MNIRQWLPHRGRLILATLAITAAAAVIAPAPASASVFCTLSVGTPRANATASVVTADSYVTCYGGFPSSINLSLYLFRDGAIVDSVLSGGSALTVATCVPGNYYADAWATVWYPFGNIPASESIHRVTPSVYISCVATPQPLVVANPGTQSTFVHDSDSLQMTASGGTAPYTWSATGLPTGLSINAGTGLISGTVTRIASYPVTVTAADPAGRTGSTQFTWNVRREACPTC